VSTNPRRITPLRASDLSGWRKSSYSGGNDNCVEITDAPAHKAVAMRDSKDPHGPALLISPAAYAAFVHATRSGRYDA
jgi:uncharacterized protein DUF397